MNFVVFLIVVVVGVLRIYGCKGPKYQAAAHLFVGGLFMVWFYGRNPHYLGFFVELCGLELACFLTSRRTDNATASLNSVALRSGLPPIVVTPVDAGLGLLVAGVLTLFAGWVWSNLVVGSADGLLVFGVGFTVGVLGLLILAIGWVIEKLR